MHLLGLSETAFVAVRGGSERGKGDGGGKERVLTLQLEHLGWEREEKEEEVVLDLGKLLRRWEREGWRVEMVEARTLTGLYAQESSQAKGRKGCVLRWEEEGEEQGAHLTLRPSGFCTIEVGMVKGEEVEEVKGEDEEEEGVAVTAVARKEAGKGGWDR